MIDELIDRPSDREDHSLEDAIRELGNDAKLHAGTSHASGRLSLTRPPEFKTDALKKLSPEQLQILFEALEKLAQERRSGHSSWPVSDIHDEVDAAFAKEIIGKLPKIVDRAVLFRGVEDRGGSKRGEGLLLRDSPMLSLRIPYCMCCALQGDSY